MDSFCVGKNDGNDRIKNASQNYRIDLYNVRMSDIVSASESNGTVTIGNILNFQGNDLLSVKFSLAERIKN